MTTARSEAACWLNEDCARGYHGVMDEDGCQYGGLAGSGAPAGVEMALGATDDVGGPQNGGSLFPASIREAIAADLDRPSIFERLLDDVAARCYLPRTHNHPPWRPMCAERSVDGSLRGACLNDDGTDR